MQPNVKLNTDPFWKQFFFNFISVYTVYFTLIGSTGLNLRWGLTKFYWVPIMCEDLKCSLISYRRQKPSLWRAGFSKDTELMIYVNGVSSI